MAGAPWHEYLVFHEADSKCYGKIIVKQVYFNAEGRVRLAGICRKCNRKVDCQCDIIAITQENAQLDRKIPLLVSEGPMSIQ